MKYRRRKDVAKQTALAHTNECTAPELGNLLTAYCFKRATEEEKRLFEAHLLECACCWREVQRLDAAVQVLETDHSLMQTLTPIEMASAVGISTKLGLPFGGHLWHAVASGVLFGLLYAVALLVEIAYEFDRYKQGALLLAPVLFSWMIIVTLGAMWADWRLTLTGRHGGLWLALLVQLAGIGLLFGGVSLFLPATPITKLTLQAYSAQAAYLKSICYFIFLQSLFALLPFHFIITMQRELQNGRHRSALGFLNSDRMSVAPRGVFPVRFWALALLLTVIISVSLFLHHNLMSHLLNVPGMNLFASLIWIRLLLFYAAGAECLIWLYRSLNELKRECLVVMRTITPQ
jgi:hypothetical protein